MNSPKPFNLFRQMEEETLEEAREWGRQRLEEKLQKFAQEEGAISPPEQSAGQIDPVADPDVSSRRRNDRG